jgi:hypothetical protein
LWKKKKEKKKKKTKKKRKKKKEKKKKRKKKKEKKKKEMLQRCSIAQRCLFKQNKHKKRKEKVSILLDHGCVGLMGARAPAPTPQQQLHRSSTAPQLELPLHSSTARASAP